ncbi:MAG: hypothetical protein RLZZ501_2619 [Pseudomonadota bacterium]|jgi:O-succinylbenzoic acid--CoA ligase
MTAPTDWLRRRATATPDAPALDPVEDVGISFAALDGRVEALAAALATLPPARLLAAETDRAEALALLALAAPRAGLALLPVNPALPLARRAGLLAAAGLSPEAVLTTLPAPAVTALAAARALPPEAVHLVIATSGSTGTPKGAMLTGANLAAAARGSRRLIPLDPGDVWLGCLPMVHIGGLSTLFRCLESGATLRLHPRFDLDSVAADLEAGRASHVSLVPAMLARLVEAGCRPAPRLRCALIGGAALSPALAERAAAAGWPLLISYGMSETASQTATMPFAAGWRPGLAGTPLPGLEIDFTPTGRIRLRGDSVMAGYLAPDLAPGRGLAADGWFETNDLGHWDEAGRLVVLGRADDILVSGGENIHPAEVEALAGRCPGVRAIGVTGRPDPAWGDLLVAVVVGEVSAETFLGWCRDHLPSPLRPRAMVKTDQLPLTPIGKPDRAALRTLARQP